MTTYVSKALQISVFKARRQVSGLWPLMRITIRYNTKKACNLHEGRLSNGYIWPFGLLNVLYYRKHEEKDRPFHFVEKRPSIFFFKTVSVLINDIFPLMWIHSSISVKVSTLPLVYFVKGKNVEQIQQIW